MEELMRAAFKVAERWLYNLTKWKAEIEVLHENLRDHSSKVTPSYGFCGGGGGVGDGTSSRAADLVASEDKLPRLESKVRMLDAAIDSLGDEQQQLVNLKYIKSWLNQNCWEHMRLSESEFYRERRKAVEKIAEIMLNSDVFIAESESRMEKDATRVQKENDRNTTVI